MASFSCAPNPAHPGTNVNNGLVDVAGGAIEFGRSMINSSSSPSTGLIAARDATLRFQAGLLNSGALNVSLLNNFKPAIGNTFQVLTANDVEGTFSNVALPQLAGGASWNVNYGAGAITLSVGGVLGDFNLDGRVDTADYTVWRNKLGTNFVTADASGNGSVDQADYNIWKANYGAVAATWGGAVASAASVPEPTSLLIAAGCGWRGQRAT